MLCPIHICSNICKLSLKIKVHYHSKNVCSEKSVSMIHSRKDEFKCDLVASWTVQVGDLDQALHLWRYTGGFSSIDKCNALLAVDKVSQQRIDRYFQCGSC